MHARLRRRLRATLERQTERLDPILDRGLGTSRDAFFPNAPEWGGASSYVAGPTPWHVLPRALRGVGASDHDVRRVRVGRFVHRQRNDRLKRVIGVEIVPEVAGFGQSLVAAHQDKYRCRNVEIVACDAAQFRVPDDLTIAYHAYGFPEKTLDVVLQNLIESIERSPRLVRFIYHLARSAESGRCSRPRGSACRPECLSVAPRSSRATCRRPYTRGMDARTPGLDNRPVLGRLERREAIDRRGRAGHREADERLDAKLSVNGGTRDRALGAYDHRRGRCSYAVRDEDVV
jgi:hypothetical protein